MGHPLALEGWGCLGGFGLPRGALGALSPPRGCGAQGCSGSLVLSQGLGCSGQSGCLEGVGVPSPLTGVGVPEGVRVPSSCDPPTPPSQNHPPHCSPGITHHPVTSWGVPGGCRPPAPVPALPAPGCPAASSPHRDQNLPLEPNNCSVLCCAVSMAPGPSFVGTCCGECLPFNYLPSSCSCLLTAWHRRLRPPPQPPAPPNRPSLMEGVPVARGVSVPGRATRAPQSSPRCGVKAGGSLAGGRRGLRLGAQRGPLGGGRPQPPPAPGSGHAGKSCRRHRRQ